LSSFLIAAFVLGFGGSFHCIGMCGPIALSLPALNDRDKWITSLLYLSGKTITYSLLGLLFGLFGKQLMLAGLQQGLSIAAGILLLIVVAMMLVQAKQLHQNKLTLWISNKLIPLFGLAKRSHGLVALNMGFVNGLLPCGLVYIGLIGSLTTGSALNGMLFMAAFGLGTMPIMLSFLLMAKQFSLNFRNKIKKLAPAFVALVAVLLIVRGLGLGIPYVSPQINNPTALNNKAVECHP
jgi:sulfite exporter TauE/SafE